MRSGAPGRLLSRGLACVLAIAGAAALTSPARAVAVDISDGLRLSSMTSGSCQGIVCPDAYGNVSVTGDTTGVLTYTVTLAAGVSFLGTGDVFYFDLTDSSGITFSSPAGYGGPVTVTGGYSPSADFPGTYDYAVTCATSLCSDTLTFTATAASGSTMVIGSPLGGGPFDTAVVPFVANLSVAAGTAGLCPGETACTGLVGAPEPSTWGMMLIGFAGLGFFGYRKARTARKALTAA
jgi:PEP-CTERM motif